MKDSHVDAALALQVAVEREANHIANRGHDPGDGSPRARDGSEVPMSLYEDRRDRMDPLDAKPAVPRPWAAMFVTWTALLDSLCAIVGAHAGVPMIAEASAAVWRWMWTLPPCSEARKAAFTLGHAALLIERWRSVPRDAERTSWGSEEDPGYVAAAVGLNKAHAIGQRAEALLRIAAWHIDDARDEARARTLGREPTIPPHERVYERDADGRFVICGRWVPLTGASSWTSADGHVETGHTVLADHFEHRRGTIKGSPLELGKLFTELAIVFLPDRPWVMTTRDVGQFLELIMEDLA